MNEQKIIETLEEMILMYNREHRLSALENFNNNETCSKFHLHTAKTLRISIDGISTAVGVEIENFNDSFEVNTWKNGRLICLELYYDAIRISQR